ncbi:hypothetical protein LJR161_004375 [Variovorax paradoxus]|uniref:DNA translocase FtsK n=1 Tax=Variovorax paradoxus TaxID=34073 RepID=UPI003ED16A70
MFDEATLAAARTVLTTVPTPGQFASVSLIQRHLKLGHGTALAIMERLHSDGVVTAPDAAGKRYLCKEMESTANRNFAVDALERYCGCDSDALHAGTPDNPSLWILGIEHGTFNSRHAFGALSTDDDTYSIATQMSFPFNKRLFALLASLAGERTDSWREYAHKHQPFVRGTPGYFKGNLYPVACKNIAEWTHAHADETGFACKAQYAEWCIQQRLPVIRSWIVEHGPKLVIGLGVTYKDEFARAVFGEAVPLTKAQFFEKKALHCFERDGLRLVVLPHLTGPSGLNSDASMDAATKFIREAPAARST